MGQISQLENKIEKLTYRAKLLENILEEIINFTNDFNEVALKDEKIFWQKLFNTAMKLIKKADYGSVYKYVDNQVHFLDSVGHNLELLQEIKMMAKVFQHDQRRNKIIIKKNIMNISQDRAKSNNFSKLSKASQPIGESITFDLYFERQLIGGLTLDIRKGSSKSFTKHDKKILKFLLILAQTFYKKDIEERFKKQQVYLEQLFEKSNVAIALLDNESKILKINRQFENLFEYKETNVKGLNIHSLITPREKLEEGLNNDQKIMDGHNINVETIRKNKSGRRIHVSLHAYPIKLDEGQIGMYALYNDITAIKKREDELNKQRAYFHQLFDKSITAIVLLSNNNRVIRANKKFEKLFGYSSEKIKGKNIDDLIVPEEKFSEGKNYSSRVLDNKTVETESIRKNKNGERINVSINAFPIVLEKGQIGVYAIYENITRRKKEEKRIKYLSFHDQLTGLYNRRFFESEMDRLNKSRLLPISIIMTDINNLKVVNDRYGHAEGDRYIKMIAESIQAAVRNEDILARVGGDEFAILLPKTNGAESKKIIKRIKNNITKSCDKHSYPVGISAGYSIKKNYKTNLKDVFKRADFMMYKIKKSDHESS